MRIILVSLFATAVFGFLGTAETSAAGPSCGAIAKAAAATSLVSKARCRVVRKCSTFGCAYQEEDCT